MTLTELTLDDLRRIFGRIMVDKKTGCWNYAQSPYQGYRKIYNVGGRNYLSHRFIFELFQDNLPDNFSELVMRHKCNNKKIVSPYHLEVITQQVNVLLN